MTEAELTEVAKYAGTGERRERLREVLITGGDPLLTPKRVNFLVEALMNYAPNITTFRIGSRVMGQSPDKVDEAVLSIFRNKPGVRFEVGTQINHPVEFFPEVCEAFARLRQTGIKIYAQNVLLKGVNDDISTLVDLYDLMRQYDIEAHYLFHCVPMIGIHHLRPSVAKGISLIRELVSSGRISGRAKPMFAAMTDIGKITFYDGVICGKEDGRLLLQSGYFLSERTDYNPGWQLPASAEVGGNGCMRVWYLDGED
jgi:lysine 2,3-aminomutase